MCGIVGFIDRSEGSAARAAIEAMRRCLAHRGPDTHNEVLYPSLGVAFGHSRLAILDLSEAGLQPMSSPSGQFEIIYNGEVYNYSLLKKELIQAGFSFRGTSDTEVMLASIEAWGIEGAATRWNGMFACAVLDHQTGKLSLIRDRAGIKPLYYGWCGGTFLFASELKALLPHPSFHGDLNLTALGDVCRFGYVPSPASIYRDIFKLIPGTVLTIDCRSADRPAGFSPWPHDLDASLRPIAFWDPLDRFSAAHTEKDQIEVGASEDHCLELLSDAVGLQMISDVPLGAFLSGGIDSSVVVALMQQHSPGKVLTFSIGFDDQRYDESTSAKAVAAHLGTEHHQLIVKPADAQRIIPSLSRIYDEPFADSSQIPTLLLSEFTRRHVTVALSGDGGDELFGGYNRYRWAPAVQQLRARLGAGLASSLSTALLAVSPERWRRLYPIGRRILPFLPELRDPGLHLHKLARTLGASSIKETYRRLVSTGDSKLVFGEGSLSGLTWYLRQEIEAEPAELLMLLDFISYLPDDILVKVDRASMAYGLEARVPFLDHRLVEFAWGLPLHHKLQGSTSKLLLRRIAARFVPVGLLDRPKWGFGLPLAEWLRGPLREWADSLLRLDTEVFAVIDRGELLKRWDEHLSGRLGWEHTLWNVLIVQDWLKHRAKVSRSQSAGAICAAKIPAN